jgi:hypothetical protein
LLVEFFGQFGISTRREKLSSLEQKLRFLNKKGLDAGCKRVALITLFLCDEALHLLDRKFETVWTRCNKLIEEVRCLLVILLMKCSFNIFFKLLQIERCCQLCLSCLITLIFLETFLHSLLGFLELPRCYMYLVKPVVSLQELRVDEDGLQAITFGLFELV